jgi:hypothetical protein
MSRFLTRLFQAHASRPGPATTRLSVELLGDRVLPSSLCLPAAIPDISRHLGLESVKVANSDGETSFTIKKTSDKASPGF